MFNRFKRMVRWQDWAPGKIPILCLVGCYLGLAYRDVSPAFLTDFLIFIFLFASSHSAYGYLVNDLGDRELDRQHGKQNACLEFGLRPVLAVLAALLAIMVLSGARFAGQPGFLALWAVWGFATTTYSLPPLRLKERGAVGLIFSFSAQWAAPVLLTFAALEPNAGAERWLFALAVTISGATLEIAHQRFDRARDLSTQTGTLGSRLTVAQLDRLLAIALFLDKVALGVIAVILTLALRPITLGPWQLSPGLPLIGTYVASLGAALYERRQAALRHDLGDPYYSVRHGAAKLLHETLPNLIAPAYLMLLAALYQPLDGLLLLAVFLFWRLVLGEADWQWPLRAIRGWRQKRTQPGMTL
jgi:4-hydroxybenzoate polyprenyltransferase